MLPKVQQDPDYLQRNNFEVLDRQGRVLSGTEPDWQAYSADNFPFTFRQREGLDNALGIVKFSFDNPYSVYLHDTNARQLFRNKQRALSHGCIRVEKAQELAQLLVSDDSTFHDPAVLARYFLQKKKREISLPKPMPLYIRYFTVVPEQGRLVFYPDIYQKDPVMVLQ